MQNPIVVVSASIGAGHDGAASEITRRLRTSGFAVRRADFLELLPAGWGRALRQMYARQVTWFPRSWSWLLGAAGQPRAARSASWLSAEATRSRLLAVTGVSPAAVVSTYPLASQAIGRLRLAGRLHAPTFAVLTDPWVHPLCVAPGIDLHLAPNDEAATVVREVHGRPVTTVAPVVSPAFRPAGDAAPARRRHGLPPDARLAVVVAGSWGVGEVEATVRDLLAGTDTVPVVLCGRNAALRSRLAATGRVIALGWVDDMPSMLRAADVVVQNAGGLTTLEALASGVPVISYRCLPGHGVANAAALERLGLVPWPRSRDALAASLEAQRPAAALARMAAAPEPAALIRSQLFPQTPEAVPA
jgi:UDP-N-acetylglucosamine:LPS N-acetylglucosamine transferase